MVRIQDSQSWHRGSIPLSTTKEVIRHTLCDFFFVIIHPLIVKYTPPVMAYHCDRSIFDTKKHQQERYIIHMSTGVKQNVRGGFLHSERKSSTQLLIVLQT